MPKIEQNELRKKDRLVVRSGQNDEVKNVIFPNGLQVGLPTQNFNHGIGLQNLGTAPSKTENALYAISDALYFNGTAIGSGGGSSLTIKDEGSDITTAATSIDFVGSSIAATTVGSDVTITVDPPVLLDIKDEGSSLTASATSIDFVGTGVTATTVGSDVTVTINTPVPTTVTRWDPEYPPAIPNNMDDEFTGSLGGWTTWDPGSTGITSAIDKNSLILEQPVIAGDKVAGIYRLAPTASAGDYDYSFYTKMSISTQDATDFPGVSLFAALDIVTNPTTSKLYVLSLMSEGSQFRAASQTWNNYSSFGGAGGIRNHGDTTMYGRIRVSYDSAAGDSTIGFDWSADGLGWHQIYQNTYSEEYKQIGISMNNVNGSSVLRGRFQFFRVYQNSSFFLEPSGSFVKIEKE